MFWTYSDGQLRAFWIWKYAWKSCSDQIWYEILMYLTLCLEASGSMHCMWLVPYARASSKGVDVLLLLMWIHYIRDIASLRLQPAFVWHLKVWWVRRGWKLGRSPSIDWEVLQFLRSLVLFGERGIFEIEPSYTWCLGWYLLEDAVTWFWWPRWGFGYMSANPNMIWNSNLKVTLMYLGLFKLLNCALTLHLYLYIYSVKFNRKIIFILCMDIFMKFSISYNIIYFEKYTLEHIHVNSLNFQVHSFCIVKFSQNYLN